MQRLQTTSVEIRLREELEGYPSINWNMDVYISKFKTLMNSLTDVDDDDKLDGFLEGLHPIVCERVEMWDLVNWEQRSGS